MGEYEEQEDRLLAYESLTQPGACNSARGQLQGLGSGIVQRRFRMATEGIGLAQVSRDGVGLQGLARSRMATSPLVMGLVGEQASESGILSKSVSFANVPPDFTTRFIDDAKIKKHLARSGSGLVQLQQQHQEASQRAGRKQTMFNMASSFAKAMYWITIFTGIFGIALSGSALFRVTSSTWHKDFGKSPVFKTAAVAAEHELCSKIGVGLLKIGGNAVDAAIGSLICVGVINNFASGVGGGGFMLVRVNASYTTVIDYRETAPADVKASDFKSNPSDLVFGGLSIAVPSQIKGIWMAHEKFGKLPWHRLFEPSIELCISGFPVNAKLTQTIERWAEMLQKSPALRETYLKQVDGKWVPKTESDIIVRPNLGNTLRQVASNGPDAFYKGPNAEAMVEENNKMGGKLKMSDLENYQPIMRGPLVASFRGLKVSTVGAPAGGAPLLTILRLLERLHLTNSTSPQDQHLFVEALKFGYAARMHIGDPAFNPEILRKEAEWFTDETIESILSKIDHAKTHEPPYYTDQFGEVKDSGTTHLTVLDKDGMAVSVTDTVNLEFGSFIMDGKTGILQNNEMADFSVEGFDNAFDLPPSPVNYVVPGKRPVSSATPIILEKDGQVVLVTGAAGGSRIISITAQFIMYLFLFKKDPIQAMISNRIYHQLFPNEVIVDHQTDFDVIEGLMKRGHKVVVLPPDLSLTSLQMILRRKNGEIWALSDPRKGGLADGY